jgi:hypothetical protein
MSALRGSILPLACTSLALAAAGAAHASTVATCATAAQQQNSGAQISVTVNQAAVVTNGTVAMALAALAATSPADAVTVAANAAGGKALLDVQTCALEAEALSWSLVRLFDVAPTRRVRDHLYRRVEQSGPVYADKAWLTFDSAGVGWVNFSKLGGTTCATFPVPFTATGGGDYEINVYDDPPPGHACNGQDCARCSWVADACNCPVPNGANPKCNHSVSGVMAVSFGGANFYLGQ